MPKGSHALWTLEAPDGTTTTTATFLTARKFLRALWNLPASPTFTRRAAGVYECSPPARGYPVKFIGPWLIYNAHGLKVLRDTLQPRHPFETAEQRPTETNDHGGV